MGLTPVLIILDDEPDDAAQDVADEEGVSTTSGSSLHSEVPHLHHDWVWYPAVRSGAMRQHLDPDFEVDRGCDLYIEDLDSDGLEYGSYFYASVAMPPVEDLLPLDSHRPQRPSYFLNEESMSEPRIWLTMNGL